PISSFMYGTAHTILETKHMSYTILLPFLAAFSIDSTLLHDIGAKTKVFFTSGILLSVILFSVYTGTLKHGDYETHVNGTGRIGWTNLSDVKQDVKLLYPSKKINILTAYKYLTFTILDVGKYANNIDVVKTESEIDYNNINNYELIIIPKAWSIDSINISNLGYIKKSNDYYNYYISKNSND
ncbi:MAG: hypothetical protein MUP82_01560, partial [Candidatus Marinimicrobia bacterium]|nr:hypothetical protein [Candidatus Neomarinimicrobiota bacterium]